MPWPALPAKGRAQPCLAACQGDSIILVISNDSFTHTNPNTIRCAVDKRQQVMEAFWQRKRSRNTMLGAQVNMGSSAKEADEGGRTLCFHSGEEAGAKRDATPSWEVSRKGWPTAIHPLWTHHTPPSPGWVENPIWKIPRCFTGTHNARLLSVVGLLGGQAGPGQGVNCSPPPAFQLVVGR